MPLTIEQAIFAGYLLVVLLIGVVASRYTQRTPDDFYIARRTVGTAILGLTFVATVLSAFTVLGIGGNVFASGPGTFAFLAIAAVFYTIIIATVGVTLYQVGREMNVVTPSEYIRKRYDSLELGVLYLAVTGVFMVSLITAQLLGGGVILDALLDIPYELAIVLMAAFMLVYIHIAGYRGVIWSDTLQAIVLFGTLGGIVAYVMFGLEPNAIATDAAAVTEGMLSLSGPIGLWSPLFVMTFALAFVFGVPAYPHTIQRYFSAHDGYTLRKSGFVFALIAVPTYFFGAVLGMWAPSIIPEPPDPDWVIPLIVEMLMHPVVFGVVMASAIAAIMSTADSVALTMSSMVSRDVYVPYVQPDAGARLQVRITQILLVAIILLSLALAWIRPTGIFHLVEFAVVGLGTTSAPVFFGAYWKRATAAASAVSLLLGPGLLILFEFGVFPTHPFGMHHGFISLLVAYVAFVGVSLLTSAPSHESVETLSRPFWSDAD